MDYITLGKNISIIRSRNHLTQEHLAEKIDVSTVFISQIETAVRKPSLETIYKIAEALDTTIDTLIGNSSLQTHSNEIAKLLSNLNDTELIFINNVIREICSNLKEHKVFSSDLN